MILVDTNIFVDIWSANEEWGAWSRRAIEDAAQAGPVGVDPIVYAEPCLGPAREEELADTLADAGVRRLPLPDEAAWPAARAFAS